MTSRASQQKQSVSSTLVSILFIVLYLTNLIISVSILKELYRHELLSLFVTDILIFCIPYLFLFICFEYDSFITKPDVVRPNPSLPFYRLLALADYWYPLHIDYSNINNRCIDFFYNSSADNFLICIINIFLTSFLFFIMSLLVPIAWLNLILLNKSNERYSVAVCLDIIIIINIISDIIILANIDASIAAYEYILNLSICSFTCGIIFTFMTAFSLSYQRMFKYNNSTTLPALCFCIELLLLFIMIVITFIAEYNDDRYFEWFFTVIAFINFLYPNVPFHKTFLMYSFVKWSTSEIYQFVIKNSESSENKHALQDMCIRLYCYLHREIHHKENINGYCQNRNCWVAQYKFLKLNNTEKLKTIYKLINNGENWKKIENLQTQKRFIYFLSSIISLVFPFWWFHLAMGHINCLQIEIFFYGLNILYLSFVVWIFIYLICKVRWTFTKLKIMMLIFSQREKVQYSVAKFYLYAMYHDLPTIKCVIQSIPNTDIALIILSYLLTVN